MGNRLLFESEILFAVAKDVLFPVFFRVFSGFFFYFLFLGKSEESFILSLPLVSLFLRAVRRCLSKISPPPSLSESLGIFVKTAELQSTY